MDFKAVEVKTLPQRALDVTPENQYWDSFELIGSKSHFGQVKCIHICPTAPHHIAVSSYDQVTIYDSISYSKITAETHFKDGVNSCRFRSDGKLMVGAGNHPVIRVWSPNIRLVRELRGHASAIHQTHFLANNIHVFSTSDDMTAKIWELATQTCIATLKGHTDYVRAGEPHPTNSHLVATGSYDKTVKVWDTRLDGERCVLELPHTAPVETLTWHPSGAFLATAAGNTVRAWDTVSGRARRLDDEASAADEADTFGPAAWKVSEKPLFSACNHQKAIPSLTYNASGSRLLTGGLDNFVKVYSTASYAVVHSLTYPAPVQAVALSPDDRDLVVGMTDGKITINARPIGAQRAPPKDDLYESHGGALFAPEPSHKWRREIKTVATEEDVKLEARHNQRMEGYNYHLRKFAYRKALDAALEATIRNENTDEDSRLTLISVLEELFRRNGLRIALQARTDKELLPILRFVDANLVDPRYCSLMTSVLEVIMEIYAGVVAHSDRIELLMESSLKKVKNHVTYLQQMAIVDGMLDCMRISCEAQSCHKLQLQETTASAE